MCIYIYISIYISFCVLRFPLSFVDCFYDRFGRVYNVYVGRCVVLNSFAVASTGRSAPRSFPPAFFAFISRDRTPWRPFRSYDISNVYMFIRYILSSCATRVRTLRNRPGGPTTNKTRRFAVPQLHTFTNINITRSRVHFHARGLLIASTTLSIPGAMNFMTEIGDSSTNCSPSKKRNNTNN